MKWTKRKPDRPGCWATRETGMKVWRVVRITQDRDGVLWVNGLEFLRKFRGYEWGSEPYQEPKEWPR